MNIQNLYYPDGLPEPITRREVYLSAAAGADASLPDPITREEVYLKAIAEGGGGGGGGSGLPPVTPADNGKVLGVKDGVWDAVTKTLHVPIVQTISNRNTSYKVKTGYETIVYESIPAADVIFFDFEDSSGVRLHVSNAVEKVNNSIHDVEWSHLSLKIEEGSKYLFYSSEPGATSGALSPDGFLLLSSGYSGDGNPWWVSDQVLDLLEITLTPTAQDMSGTMDYTSDVILTAYRNGARIRAKIPSFNAEFDFTQFSVANDTIVCCGSILYNVGGQDVLIKVVTAPDAATYSTTIYPLTAM